MQPLMAVKQRLQRWSKSEGARHFTPFLFVLSIAGAVLIYIGLRFHALLAPEKSTVRIAGQETSTAELLLGLYLIVVVLSAPIALFAAAVYRNFIGRSAGFKEVLIRGGTALIAIIPGYLILHSIISGRSLLDLTILMLQAESIWYLGLGAIFSTGLSYLDILYARLIGSNTTKKTSK